MEKHPLEQWREDASKPWTPELQQDIMANRTLYDDSLVLPYTVPEPLKCFDGKTVTTPHEWFAKRRPELLKWFTDNFYGPLPPRPDQTTYEVLEESDDALDGTAIRRQIRLNFAMANGKTHTAEMLIYLPKNANGKVPAFLGLNFKGNHTTVADEAVHINPRKADLPRAESERRWPHKDVVARGYASATCCYHDFFPDATNGWEESIWSLFDDTLQGFDGTHPKYGAISAWAWGLSRLLDCLETLPEVDATRVVVHGHSRLGKTALWAGVNDQRFRMVVSNDSGCGGAALSRRWYGETFLVMLNVFRHWCPAPLRQYIVREPEMPVDQHELIAMVAPRPVAVASATEDQWADPKGEFLSAYHAGPVYQLLGHCQTLGQNMPQPGEYVSGDVSYHYRVGVHDQIAFDWEHYLEVADKLV